MISSEQTPKEPEASSTVELQAMGDTSTHDTRRVTLSGWRLKLLTTGLNLCCFLSALDAIIVTTSLTAIAEDLRSFDESSWVVSSFLTCYFSFLIIWAKVSDLVGRKVVLVAAVVFFLAFSGGCGGARSTLQLIILRAFQGIGGAGVFSMVPIVTAEMVPPDRYAAFSSIVSISIALSFLLGPLLGGVITDGASWRWIFYINLPVGAVGLFFVYVAMPGAFPDVSNPSSLWVSPRKSHIRRKVDYPGFILLLAASVLLIVAIEQAGISFSWDSALVIVLLIFAIMLLIGFMLWEWYLHRSRNSTEPVFPWRFVKHRFLLGACLISLLSGVPYMTLVLGLPGRFQNLNNDSGLDAGIHILPFTLSIAMASASASGLTARGRLPPIAVFAIGAALQVLGVGLLYSVYPSSSLPARIYGYQILAGVGIGLSLTTTLNIMPFVVDRKDLSVALGAVIQLRILGGALGVAISANLLNNTLRSQLSSEMPSTMIQHVLQDIFYSRTLSTSQQQLVQAAFADGYRKQLLMVLVFAAAQLFALAIMWEKPLRRLA
ncbi:MFS general substrate transporter [Aspergillus steynii IBT 23096]|uniref:MFS general substrate transporter n=1 Tax=Aspergillus steynii IBT 23096 TaxID=1392250 RepID=A0A2I2G724_9EURO|nr:MFS general substrate transporter [Aspergillus steynii IBT 23096]PLB48687.1 MFS general substrate transporter [Aspergillus steynii IBT 23096]